MLLVFLGPVNSFMKGIRDVGFGKPPRILSVSRARLASNTSKACPPRQLARSWRFTVISCNHFLRDLLTDRFEG
ncbi:UL12 [Human betaherpesvirus 5]|uniref:Uncharacterized protein UL12 n=2 Tax=Human cytomegalovirus TaxID=10359 RepID=UL12_HCMVA|nr:RecName: Full=Uncharacterized protein UL12 [Human herpesvirus 5 strain AD169]ABV71542.1 UL12 [Human betaherpesvirus 5]APA46057.1 UL12 [Human betaherpesvirus 5]UBQ34270.1 UL12 [Human betaherpesvirus 5]CAA35446.1 HCMVUL12 [Human betaherpesvirus 5]